MSEQEEDLQRRIEQLNVHDTERDKLIVKAYDKVFETLRKEPDFVLPANFADKIVSKVVESKTKTSPFSPDHLWFGIGIFLLIASFCATLIITKTKIVFEVDLGFLKHMSSYKGLFFFGLIFILILHIVDKKVIRTKQAH